MRRQKKLPLFLALLPERENLAHIMEALYAARLLRQRQSERHYRLAAIIHPNNAQLIQASALFDEIFLLDTELSLRKQISRHRPALLFLPDSGLQAALSVAFSRSKVRILAGKPRLFSRILRCYASADADDQARLSRYGADLFSDRSPFFLELPTLPAESLPHQLRRRRYIWAPLFDRHTLTGGWALEHSGRLARLLKPHGVDLVIHLPNEAAQSRPEASSYLRSSTSGVTLLEDLSAESRVAAMLHAEAVVGPAGAETIFASLLGLPLEVLHTNRTFRHEKRLYLSAFVPRKQHLSPHSHDCKDNCDTCHLCSCVDLISPEQIVQLLESEVFRAQPLARPG